MRDLRISPCLRGSRENYCKRAASRQAQPAGRRRLLVRPVVDVLPSRSRLHGSGCTSGIPVSSSSHLHLRGAPFCAAALLHGRASRRAFHYFSPPPIFFAGRACGCASLFFSPSLTLRCCPLFSFLRTPALPERIRLRLRSGTRAELIAWSRTEQATGPASLVTSEFSQQVGGCARSPLLPVL